MRIISGAKGLILSRTDSPRLSPEEHDNARYVILHVVLRVPLLRRKFDQLLAAVLGILLSPVEKLDGLSHLTYLDLVGDAVRADQDGSIFLSVAGNHTNCWSCYDAAGFG